MKHTLLILSLLFVQNFVFSQTSAIESDTTWQETVTFINEYKDSIHAAERLYDLIITGESLSFVEFKGAAEEQIWVCDLLKLKSVSDANSIRKGQFLLRFIGNDCVVTRTDEGRTPQYKGKFFKINDDAIRLQVIKAFEHLAKLAAEKRAASGVGF
jgi:hypothetical protein